MAGGSTTSPGRQPLALEDARWFEELQVPESQNAGCLPPNSVRKEIVTLGSLLTAIEEEDEKRRKLKELDGKLLRLNLMRKRPLHLEDFPEYRDRAIEKLTG
jgi:hypothetical protein